jgi:hypothetical protein
MDVDDPRQHDSATTANAEYFWLAPSLGMTGPGDALRALTSQSRASSLVPIARTSSRTRVEVDVPPRLKVTLKPKECTCHR